MKPTLGVLLAAAVCVSMAFAPLARADWDLILKTGSYTLSDDSQRIENISLTLDDSASSVFGVEGQWYARPDVAIGGEYFQFSSDWTSGIGTSGDIDASALMFNIKKYFNTEKAVQPYIGAGLGFAGIDFTGPGGSTTGSDIAFQAMAGVAVKGKKVGFYSELKWFSSEPEDDVGEEVDIGGTGLFAGVSLHF